MDKLSIEIKLTREDGSEHFTTGEVEIIDRATAERDGIGLLAAAATIAGEMGTEIAELVLHDCRSRHDPSFFRVPGDARS